MKTLAIVGASGHGKVIGDTAELVGWERCVFFDDAYPNCSRNEQWPVLGTFGDLVARLAEFDGVFVAIGHNAIRRGKLQELLQAGANVVSLVHPNACVSRYAQLGSGSAVLPGAVINAYARTGMGAILNTQSSVDHDCILGDGVHISPAAHLGGNVSVGDGSWVGIGASVRQGTRIGCNVVVGAGAAVVQNLPDDVTATGVPASFSAADRP